MKIILALTLFSTVASAEIFIGNGHCWIQSLPCKDGSSVSCSAQGPYGGYCVVEKSGKYFVATCGANGGSTVRRSCLRK